MHPSSAKNRPRDTATRPTQDWQQHEHVAAAAQAEAQKLVDAAGSVELAKQAIDAASEPASSAPDSRSAFAERLGFDSYLEIFESAEPIVDSDQTVWMVVAVGHKFVVWNEGTLRPMHFKSREDAIDAIQSGRIGQGARPLE
jgi:hypothetical protein